MKNSLCFPCFLNSSKPNRLVFQEKLPEGQKSLPKESTDSREKIQESHTLAYERLLVLETFRRKVFETWGLNFEGRDFTESEKATNEVFQYLYEKLDRFFKESTSPEWPIDRQKEWMTAVADFEIACIYFGVDLITPAAHALGFLPFSELSMSGQIHSKKDVDDAIPDHIIGDYVFARGPGTFPAWLSRKYPKEYRRIFKKSTK